MFHHRDKIPEIKTILKGEVDLGSWFQKFSTHICLIPPLRSDVKRVSLGMEHMVQALTSGTRIMVARKEKDVGVVGLTGTP